MLLFLPFLPQMMQLERVFKGIVNEKRRVSQAAVVQLGQSIADVLGVT